MNSNKTKKVLANTLLLVFIMAIVMLPSVSSGIMKVNKDDRVLSVMDKRPEAPAAKNVKTIIIKEIPQKKSTPIINTIETTETTESTATDR